MRGPPIQKCETAPLETGRLIADGISKNTKTLVYRSPTYKRRSFAGSIFFATPPPSPSQALPSRCRDEWRQS